jgi:uncharacterized membrane protein YfcA
MSAITLALLAALIAFGLYFAWRWFAIERAARTSVTQNWPGPLRLTIGFVTNFFDTLGIGSFAPTTSLFKLLRVVPDEQIPGTLNVGHVLPTVLQGLIFIALVSVDATTLVGMILAAVLGARLGADVVARLPRPAIQLCMGLALLVAATLFVLSNVEWLPAGGNATGLHGGFLAFAIAVNFVLGALMTLGIGLYAPCLILVSLLGMNPIAAFPIMMGSCAFLMPVAAARFVLHRRYNLRAALGLLIGGLPAVLIAAFIVKQLPLEWLRWLVVVVIVYAAVAMLRSAWLDSRQKSTSTQQLPT